MKAEQSIVGMYAGLKPRARIKFLIKHYKDFDTYRADYRDSVVSIIMAFNEYNRSNHDDLGVRVQSSGGNQDTTFNMVAEKMSVEEYFKYLEVDKDSFPDPYEYMIVSTALFEWNLMKREYDEINSCMKLLLNQSERELLLLYLKKEQRLIDIATYYSIEIDSARKKLYRIKRKLINGMIPWFKDYSDSILAVG